MRAVTTAIALGHQSDVFKCLTSKDAKGLDYCLEKKRLPMGYCCVEFKILHQPCSNKEFDILSAGDLALLGT